MPDTADQLPAQPPFGTYSLSPFRNRLRRWSGPWRERVRLFNSVLRQASVLGLNEPFDVEPVSGFKVRLFPSNNATDKKAFMGLGIDRDCPDIDAMSKAVADVPHDTVQFLDIGGNSGMYSIAAAKAAKLAGKKIRIVAIEANPDMVERYRFNLEASGVDDVEIVCSAVSDHTGSVFMSFAKPNLGQAKVVASADFDKTIELPARLLVDILDEVGMERIDFLKIDIEGHEGPALKPFFENAPKSRYPKQILIELAHDQDTTIDDLLTAHGYEMTSDLIYDAVYSLRDNH